MISLESQAGPVCLLLHEGTVAVYREQGHLLMRYAQAPMVFGMNELFDANEGWFYQASGAIRYELIPVATVIEKIDQFALWKEASYVYMYAIKRLVEAHNTSAGLSTYDLIRLNLFALMDEKEELRLSVNASDYILEKTGLSRSRIMKIISDLRTGEHIVIQRGILIAINKLPQNY